MVLIHQELSSTNERLESIHNCETNPGDGLESSEQLFHERGSLRALSREKYY